MKRDTPTIIVGVIILVVMALGVFLVIDRPAVKAEVKDTGSEIKQLGRDAADGVKDVYDTTGDAAHEAQQMAKDAVK